MATSQDGKTFLFHLSTISSGPQPGAGQRPIHARTVVVDETGLTIIADNLPSVFKVDQTSRQNIQQKLDIAKQYLNQVDPNQLLELPQQQQQNYRANTIPWNSFNEIQLITNANRIPFTVTDEDKLSIGFRQYRFFGDLQYLARWPDADKALDVLFQTRFEERPNEETRTFRHSYIVLLEPETTDGNKMLDAVNLLRNSEVKRSRVVLSKRCDYLREDQYELPTINSQKQEQVPCPLKSYFNMLCNLSHFQYWPGHVHNKIPSLFNLLKADRIPTARPGLVWRAQGDHPAPKQYEAVVWTFVPTLDAARPPLPLAGGN